MASLSNVARRSPRSVVRRRGDDCRAPARPLCSELKYYSTFNITMNIPEILTHGAVQFVLIFAIFLFEIHRHYRITDRKRIANHILLWSLVVLLLFCMFTYIIFYFTYFICIILVALIYAIYQIIDDKHRARLVVCSLSGLMICGYMSSLLTLHDARNDSVNQLLIWKKCSLEEVQIYEPDYFRLEDYWSQFSSENRDRSKKMIYVSPHLNGMPFLVHTEFGHEFQGWATFYIGFFGLEWRIITITTRFSSM